MAAGQTAGVADRVLDGDLVPLTLRLHSCPDVAVAGDWTSHCAREKRSRQGSGAEFAFFALTRRRKTCKYAAVSCFFCLASSTIGLASNSAKLDSKSCCTFWTVNILFGFRGSSEVPGFLG